MPNPLLLIHWIMINHLFFSEASFTFSFLLLLLPTHIVFCVTRRCEIVLNSKHDNTVLDLLHSSSIFLVQMKKSCLHGNSHIWQQTHGSKFVYFFHWCSNDMVDKEASSACCLHEHLGDMPLCVLDFATDLFASSYFVRLTNITSILLRLWRYSSWKDLNFLK